MKIICAGFPKTGTKSMATALHDLGFSVHDFEEHLELNLENYLDFLDGKKDSSFLMEQYRDIDVVVDQPACTLWYIFFKHYPEAKVILMERESPEVWQDSYSRMLEYYNTNQRVWYEKYIRWFSATREKFDRLSIHNMTRSTACPDNFFDLVDLHTKKELWMYQYIMHNAAVKQLVPADQLLVFQVGEGWERLCKFLGKPVPEEEFPRENVGGTKNNITDKMVQFNLFDNIRKEFRISMALIGIGAAILVSCSVLLMKK